MQDKNLDKNIEIMKRIIEEKKKRCSEQGSILRPQKSIGQKKKANKTNKTGGLFDR